MFLREWLTNYHDTGAIAPSSRFLARRIVEEAGIGPESAVLELGPGTGAITRTIVDSLGEDGEARQQYFGIEINPRFHDKLRNRFPDLHFERASAADHDLHEVTEKAGQFDAVVSGLPWVGFKRELQEGILDNILPHLRPGGKFTTFAYTGPHLRKPGQRFRKLLEDRFASLKQTRTVFLNLPPAFVYVATKKA